MRSAGGNPVFGKLCGSGRFGAKWALSARERRHFSRFISFNDNRVGNSVEGGGIRLLLSRLDSLFGTSLGLFLNLPFRSLSLSYRGHLLLEHRTQSVGDIVIDQAHVALHHHLEVAQMLPQGNG
jgi:hypothetical protein